MIALHQALQLLERGELIAYPTEAMYGLGCDPWIQSSVNKILALKERHWEMGVILVIGELEHATPWIKQPSELYFPHIQATWPGPTTWLFEKSLQCPLWISGAHDCVAIRFSAHPVIQSLCRAFGGAIISTSANRHKQPGARTHTEVENYFPGIKILQGHIGNAENPSAIIDVRTNVKLR